MSQRDSTRQLANRITLIGRERFERETREGHEHWIDNPTSIRLLKAAVKEKAAQVTLSSGRKFSIEYGHEFASKVTEEVTHCVLLRPTNGEFAPMGYIALKKLGL